MPFEQSYGPPHAAPIGKLVTHVFAFDAHKRLAH
jgi:hypothetical protein